MMEARDGKDSEEEQIIIDLKAYYLDALVLIGIIAPAALIVVAVALGGGMSAVEDWPFVDGFWYVMSNMSGQPNPFISKTPATICGRSADIIISIYSVVASTLIIGSLALLSNVSSLSNLPFLSEDRYGIVLLLVVIPVCAFSACSCPGRRAGTSGGACAIPFLR
eukprot:TRINITY_DN56448_c0_g1_i1.p1 TRINITY_DN56448_c0_g1~~TRINITY_DN56448_c0_g1_i1.p1  ORF type:complete len:180 (-),score=25.04 TRINITY_DN56448_c0_g1_i1:495-989(-)